MTDEFLTMFIDNLKSIFPYEIDKYFMLYNTGTTGWSKAFIKTCDDLKMDTLREEYTTLDWEEFDFSCAELGKIIVEKGLVN